MRLRKDVWLAVVAAVGSVLLTGLLLGLSGGVAEAAGVSPLPTPSGPWLTLFLSALPYPGVEAGGVITYAVTVVNEGPVDAERVVVTDCLPTYTTFLSPLSSPAPQVGPRTVWWELGPLAGDGAESRSVTFTVRVAPTAPTGVELVNRVVATADGGNPAAAALVHRVNRFQAQLVPEEGGRLRAPLAGVEARFPAGAVSGRVQISLTVMTTPTQEARAFQLVGQVFFLEGVDTQGDSVTSFLRPYTLTVRYEDEGWRAAGLEQETDLNLFYWHRGRWVPILPCPGCRVDVEANRVVAVLEHFTEFALGQTQEVFLPLVVRGR